MKPIEKSVALELLGEDLDLIHNCVRLGWGDFQEDFTPAQRMKFCPRTRANMVNDLIIERAKSAFDGHIRAEFFEINQMWVAAFQSGIAVRFKKLDEGFSARNIPTQQALNFVRQGALPGIGEGVNLNAGYRLDAFATKLEGIYLTCPRGKKSNHWWHELGKDAGEGDGFSHQLPFAPDSGAPATPAEKPYKIVRRGGEEKDAADQQ